jgi:hypothetical protein
VKEREPRTRFGLVGKAVRQAVTRASGAKLSDGDRRTFEAVIALVSTYSRLSDRVYVADVSAISGLSERQTRDCLAKLARLDIIVWQPRRGTDANGVGLRSVLGFHPHNQTGTYGLPVSSDGAREANRNFGPAQTGSPALPETEQDRAETSHGPEHLGTTTSQVDVAREGAQDDLVESTDRLVALTRQRREQAFEARQ